MLAEEFAMKWLAKVFSRRSRPTPASPRRGVGLALEWLEDRLAPASLTLIGGAVEASTRLSEDRFSIAPGTASPFHNLSVSDQTGTASFTTSNFTVISNTQVNLGSRGSITSTASSTGAVGVLGYTSLSAVITPDSSDEHNGDSVVVTFTGTVNQASDNSGVGAVAVSQFASYYLLVPQVGQPFTQTLRLNSTIGSVYDLGVAAAGAIVIGTPPPPGSFLGQATLSYEITSRQPPSVTPTSLNWDTIQGGADYGYQVSGGTIPSNTQVALYWSRTDRFADRIGGPIPGTSTTIAAGTGQGTYGPFHATPNTLANITGLPPEGATHLLVVTDPNNVLGNFSESTNVRSLLYNPTVMVKAKYDGNPGGNEMGRYFTNTSYTHVLQDNFYTVTLSDSLAALRPQVEVKIGGQEFAAALDPSNPVTYTTQPFDPGSLSPGRTPLMGEALIGTRDIADFSSTILVEPLSGWILGLSSGHPDIRFDPLSDGGHGAYVFDGFLPGLSLQGTVFTIPDDVPFIGGLPLQYTAGFEVNVVAPLAVSSTPTLKGGLQANLTLGPSITLPVLSIGPTVEEQNGNWRFTVTPGATLDPVTLNANGAFLTLALDYNKPQALQATLYHSFDVVFPFDIPTFLEFDVTASLGVMLHAHAQIAYDSANGLEFLSGGTYLGVGITGTLAATAQAGWFAPAWVQNLLDTRYDGGFHIASFTLSDKATLTLNGNAEAHFGGPVGALERTGALFTGSATVSDSLHLTFVIGGTTLFDLPIADLSQHSPTYTWPLP
jgi:hypothetical protein